MTSSEGTLSKEKEGEGVSIVSTDSRLTPVEPTPRGALQLAGIHPLAALLIISTDTMLFGSTLVTGGAALVLSLPVGLAVGAVTVVMQRKSYGDSRWVAVAKGVAVAVLTAIPTPLPSFITTGSGVLGLIALRKGFPLRSSTSRSTHL